MASNRLEQAEGLRRCLQQLVRSFGVLAAEGTPCGKPLSVVHGHALMVLLTRGELSQQELGAELCIDKSNVARVCVKMVEAGHARQRPSEQDGRSRRVSLTARGLRMAREVEASSAARFGALLDRLPPRRAREIVESLECLVAAVRSLPAAAFAAEQAR